ncbi:MAG: hypothetical protein HOC24_13040 [Deltaproteobacteria bacterium]|jgi:rhodanese-related sulfurtransferase|nr:hypothetical protein [Deltaproteobacteria bacterium]
MLLLTDGQSRLAITFGSVFFGLLLVILAYFNGNSVAVKPDYRDHRSFVFEKRIRFSELYNAMVNGKRNFSIIGFRTPKECMRLIKFNRFFKCFNKEKLLDIKWIRKQFPNLKSPLVIFGADKDDSFNFAVKMRYYGFNSRMLDGGIDDYLYDYLAIQNPLLKESSNTQIIEKTSNDKFSASEKEKKHLFYSYLTGEIETFQETQRKNFLKPVVRPITGTVQFVSWKNRVFEVKNYINNEILILSFDKETRFINAKSFYQFDRGDLVDIWISDNNKAIQIKRKIVNLPAINTIKTKKLERVIRKQKDFILIDVRKKQAYNQAHLPYAINIENYKLGLLIKTLNLSQNTPLIIYGDGPTQPLIKSAFETLRNLAFKNIEVYAAGITEWKKQKKILVIDNKQLAKYQSEYLVLDIRPHYLSQISSIKHAVAIESYRIMQKELSFVKNKIPKKQRILKNIKDKTYPIVLYDSYMVELKSLDIKGNFFQPDINDIFEILLNWGYKNIVVLEGGFFGWQHNYPITHEQNENEVQLVSRKEHPGALSLSEFKQQVEKEKAKLLDVRTINEVKKGKINNSIHIPLQIIKSKSQQLDRSNYYIIYCANGMRAKSAYLILKQMGFKKVAYLNSNFQ